MMVDERKVESCSLAALLVLWGAAGPRGGSVCVGWLADGWLAGCWLWLLALAAGCGWLLLLAVVSE